MSAEVFSISDHARLILTEKVQSTFSKHIQSAWYKSEAGGVLLGRHLLESKDIVIDEITEPQRQDIRSRFSFFRSNRHNYLAKEQWLLSNQIMAYLGLWHTHPEHEPNPSSTDINDWKNALSHDTYTGNKLFFVIVGIKNIGIWMGNRDGKIIKLEKQINEKNG
jgi:integrative and conjugative element protein (TIGR02256 family)